jgi:hypothetical protein
MLDKFRAACDRAACRIKAAWLGLVELRILAPAGEAVQRSGGSLPPRNRFARTI